MLRFCLFLEERYDLIDFVGDYIPVLVLMEAFPGLLFLGTVRHVIFVDRFAFGLFLLFDHFLLY